MALKKKKRPAASTPAWMVSWSDMTTLMLTFFITMMSFGDIEQRDFFLMLSSFRGTFGLLSGGGSNLDKGRLESLGFSVQSLPSESRGVGLGASRKNAMSILEPEVATRMVRVSEDERGLIITLSGDIFFDPGSAVLKTEVRPVLNKVGKILNSVPNLVRIEGHASSTPVGLSKMKGYATNWELAAARSVNVLRYLEEEDRVDPNKLSAVSFGEYRPLDINDTPEGRAFNQRVDIVVLREFTVKKSANSRIKRPLPDEEWR